MMGIIQFESNYSYTYVGLDDRSTFTFISK